MSQTLKNNAEKDNYYHNKVPRPVTTKMKTLTACRSPSNSWQYRPVWQKTSARSSNVIYRWTACQRKGRLF